MSRNGRTNPIPVLRWRLRAASAVLWTERLGLAFWASLSLLAAIAGLALLGVPALLPVWLHMVLLLGVLAVYGAMLARGMWRLALPGRADAERRLERDTGLRHRPFAVLRDTPAAGGPASLALWQRHVAQAQASIATLRLSPPDPKIAVADPYALRVAAFLLLATGLVIAGPQSGLRLASLFAPQLSGWQAAAPPLIQAWVQPPGYTGLPPLFLPPPGTQTAAIQVPKGSRLTISITGLGARPSLSLAGASHRMEPLGSDSFQAVATLDQGGHLGIGTFWRSLGGWDLAVLPNEPPKVAWTAPPGRAGTSLSTRFPWQAAQRWGVADLQAEMRPKDRPDLPATIVKLPLPGTPKDAKGIATEDLAENPLAGVMMTGHLVARDVSGQSGAGDALDFVLPARTFHHPLARAIADLRRRLALHPETAADAAADLDALAQAPFGPEDHSGLFASGVTLNLAAAAALLTPAKPAIPEAQARLWTLALALDGALPDAAARALAEARARLKDAMEDRANGKMSQKELSQRLDDLREALDKRLAEIGKQAAQRGAIEKFDPSRQHLSSNALDKMIKAMEQAAREGRMDDAKRAMAQMEKMLDQLKNAHIMTKEETQQRQEQARRGRQIMGAVQDLVRRETGLLDHAQARAPAPPPPSLGALPPQFRNFAFPPQGPSFGGTDEPPEDQPMTPDQLPQNAAPDSAEAPPPSAPASPRQQQDADARTQRALHRALGALSQSFAASGGQPPRSLDDAGHAMDDAARSLGSHQDPMARDAIGRAIAALQQGGQSMSRQMSAGAAGQMQLSLQPGGQSGEDGSGQEGEDGQDDGHGGRKKDPFGRQVDGNGTTADDPNLRVPDEMEQGRSRAIQEELRRRGADRERPKGELDYIDRLLKPF